LASDELSYPAPRTEADYQSLFEEAGSERKLPRRDEYVEASRLCILPAMRGRGLWYLLAAHMISIGCRSNRHYIVGSAIDELLPTWEKVGFERTGLRYFNEDIGGRIHEMIILELNSVIGGACDSRFYPYLISVVEEPPKEETGVSQILSESGASSNF
jgi:hypothetical protein